MPAWAIALIVVGGVLLICTLWIVITYNVLTRSKIAVDEAFSSMDVQLKKRYDLIPNIVNTVKGYAKHEKETLEQVISMRNLAVAAPNAEAKIKADGELSGAISRLFALAESYPELKADRNFAQLQGTLTGVENEIAASRRYYNAIVKLHNTKVRVFPSNVIARWFKFSTMPMYEVGDAQERANVKVEF